MKNENMATLIDEFTSCIIDYNLHNSMFILEFTEKGIKLKLNTQTNLMQYLLFTNVEIHECMLNGVDIGTVDVMVDILQRVKQMQQAMAQSKVA